MRAKITAIAVAMAFVLTGCGTDESAEDRYIESLSKNASIELTENSRQDLIDLGYIICEKTEEEGPAAIINTYASNPVMDPRDFGVMVGAATRNLCPEQRQAWIDYGQSLDTLMTL